jgi:predicted transcriptional regulator
MDKPPVASPAPPLPQPTPITSVATLAPAPVPVPALLVSTQQIEWLVRAKPAALILLLKNSGEQNMSSLAKNSSLSYVHTIQVVKNLQEKGLATAEAKGNRKIVRLTDAGIVFASALEDLAKKVPQKR